MQPLSSVQAKGLLEAACDDRFGALYVLAITAGLRQGQKASNGAVLAVKEVFVVDSVTSKGADGWPPIQLGRNHAGKAGRGLDRAAASDDPGVRSSLRSSRIAPRCHLLLTMANSKICQAQKIKFANLDKEAQVI